MGTNIQKGWQLDCRGCSKFQKSEKKMTLETTDDDLKRLRPRLEIGKMNECQMLVKVYERGVIRQEEIIKWD